MSVRRLASEGAVLFLLGAIAVLAGCGGGGSNTQTPVNNTVALMVGFGPNGESGGYPDGVYTTIQVCQHGTSSCVTIDNVLVDTGSVGLRLVPSALGSVSLTGIGVNPDAALFECIQFGDTSYSWGPMELADVHIAGENASDIPIQLIGATTISVPNDCLTVPVNPQIPNGGNLNTETLLNANGILGIGDRQFDCGNGCGSDPLGSPYYACVTGVCEKAGNPTSFQSANPVAAFASDKNGVMITFPSVSASGSGPVAGTMNFGIATQSDNALGSATIYAMDECGFFPSVYYGGVQYPDELCLFDTGGLGGVLDTGTNVLLVSDAGTLAPLGIYDCASGTSGYGLYCVTGSGATTLSNVALAGYGNVGSGTTSLNIADATTLINSNNAVFDDLGGESCDSTFCDYFVFGLPFFFGKTVFIGIAGETVPNNASAPYGFVAF